MTPAVTAAKRAGIAFEILQYEHQAAAPSYGLEAAAALGRDPAEVFKTLVAEVDGSLVVAMVPAESRLDLKMLAVAVGGKRAAMADPGDAERATGYVLGGISPLGQRRRLPMVLDATAAGRPTILVSAGRRGLEIELAPDDLIRVTGATMANIAG